MHPSQTKYLGFKIMNEDSKPEYYEFVVMIYGIKVAAAVVTRLIKPLVAHLHGQGCRFSIYIDDGRTVGPSSQKTMEHHKLALDVFSKAGWNIQFSKMSNAPTQLLLYQGFIVDSANMLYYLPKYKKACIY